MSQQPSSLLDLFDAAAAAPQQGLQARFEEFHRRNPQVFEELVRLARGLVERGHQRFGMATLFEVLRWQSMMATTDPSSSYKLNNSYRSRYARLMKDRHPELATSIELRALHTD